MAATQMYAATILPLAVIIVTITVASAGMQDVCQWEMFEAKCQDDEVVLIKKARYGRMKVGHCQPRNYFVGCSTDVTATMHARCSGHQHCRVPVPDPIMFAATPCPKDLVTYLEADYECVKVAKSNTDNCNNQILTTTSGYITKPPSKISSQRTICPHRVMAQPGQIVNIYLYDFYSNTATHNMVKPQCIPYGYISETSVNVPIQICGGDFRTNQLIHSSKANFIDITLTTGSALSHHYMIHYEVIGCPTLKPPTNSWMKVTGNHAVITCNNTNIVVSLVCTNNKWVGDLQNCTQFIGHPFGDSITGKVVNDIFANTGMFVIICIGLALGVLFGMGLLAFSMSYIKDRRTKKQHVIGIPPACPIQKPIDYKYDPATEKPLMPVDQYQPVYMPVASDQYPMAYPIYETPLLHSFSDIHTSQPAMGAYTRLDSHMPIARNTYGPLYSEPQNAIGNCGYHLYDLAALGHTLGREKIISIEDVLH